MIRAVFFDFYNTLVKFDPPREELQAKACLEFGIHVVKKAIPLGYCVADDYMSRENARQAIQKRTPEEAQLFWGEYEAVLLRTAGANVDRDLAFRILARVRQLDRKLVLFEDVIPLLTELRRLQIKRGLISNLTRRLAEYTRELGLTGYIDFALTSLEVGAEKPHAPLFLKALEQAGVAGSESLHVGDQYYADVLGARAVGIKALLLDRDGFWAQIEDCPRIKSLAEVQRYLD
ncbi:MAG: HAD-IA family hydrolase [Dehalococcoidia bacterium]|nr:HAD-IA family hydrolase [Dehalococcoidia bacterium]